ncbi:MAG: hypothetical protein KGJ02_02720 [Verrucomicrobiota bacterium]|nr:hypothetical protein [Verrucomicrobiota bacterium]
MTDLRQKNRELAAQGKDFGGTARIYSTLSSIDEPTTEEGYGKYFEHLVLGPLALDDTLRSYNTANLNPFYEE